VRVFLEVKDSWEHLPPYVQCINLFIFQYELLIEESQLSHARTDFAI